MQADGVNGDWPYRSYLLILVGFVLATVVLLTAVAAFIEPLEGELTRLGGYAERHFGWNGVQRRLPADAVLEDRYEKYFDVVVVGDSFSKPGHWQSVLRMKTGVSFTTLDIVNTPLDGFASTEPFTSTPPKLMVVEIGERLLLAKFGSSKRACGPPGPAQSAPRQVLPMTPTPIEFRETPRARALTPQNINLRYALLFAHRSLVRWLLDRDFTPVGRYALSRSGLFSNARNSEILVYNDDLIKLNWTEDAIRAAACAIRELQERVQANGRTRFVLLPIPDKSSAYADYIVDPRFRSMQPLHRILSEQGINLARIDTHLKRAIDSGERDVYLPNDTHFGFRGYELAAQSVLESLGQP